MQFRRIQEENSFVTRKLSKGVTTIKIAKVLRCGHWEVISMLQPFNVHESKFIDKKGPVDQSWVSIYPWFKV